jgi:hypothetical protein
VPAAGHRGRPGTCVRVRSPRPGVRRAPASSGNRSPPPRRPTAHAHRRRCRTPPPAAARSWPGGGPLPGRPARASRCPAGPGPAAAPRTRAGPARRCRPRPPRPRRPAPPTGCAGAHAPAVRHRR